MNGTIEKVVIVGGGTAGWLAACSLAAARPGLDVTLVEAPDIPTIGVGEGTWPTLRATLAAISLDEAGFLTACDASFKQGSRFDGWVDGGADDRYFHPFTSPPDAPVGQLLAAWRGDAPDPSFAAAMTPQAALSDRHLAPRQRMMPARQGADTYRSDERSVGTRRVRPLSAWLSAYPTQSTNAA